MHNEDNQVMSVQTKDEDLDWWLSLHSPGRIRPDNVVATVMRQATLEYYKPDDPRHILVSEFVGHLDKGPLLVVLGNIGRGKTYLGGLIAREVLLRDWRAGEQWYYNIQPTMVRWPAFLNDWKSAEDWSGFVRHKVSCLTTDQLLIIDELGREGGMTNHERSTFEMMLDERYTVRKPTVLLSNMPRAKFEQYMQPVLMSRLNDWASHTPTLGFQVLRGPDERGE